MNNYSLDPGMLVLNQLSTLANSNTTSASSEASSDLDLSEFRDLMLIMMLGNMNFGSSQSGSMSGMGSMGGMDMNMLMAPMMMTLLEKLMATQVENPQTAEQTPTPPTSRSTPSGMPINGRLTQGSHNGHIALDFGAPVGTKVESTMDGKVVYAGWNDQGYGNLVIVENGPYRTYYAHLSKIPVSVGQQVTAGSVIGISGNTGNSTGPHLHYEIRKNRRQIDPTQLTLNT